MRKIVLTLVLALGVLVLSGVPSTASPDLSFQGPCYFTEGQIRVEVCGGVPPVYYEVWEDGALVGKGAVFQAGCFSISYPGHPLDKCQAGKSYKFKAWLEGAEDEAVWSDSCNCSTPSEPEPEPKPQIEAKAVPTATPTATPKPKEEPPRCEDPGEPDDKMASAHEITGDEYHSFWKPGDEDWVKFWLDHGDTVRLQAVPLWCYPTIPMLRLFDQHGSLLKQNAHYWGNIAEIWHYNDGLSQWFYVQASELYGRGDCQNWQYELRKRLCRLEGNRYRCFLQ